MEKFREFTSPWAAAPGCDLRRSCLLGRRLACGGRSKGVEHFSNALKGTDKWAVPPPRSTQHTAQHPLMALGLGLAHRSKFPPEPDFPISFPAGPPRIRESSRQLRLQESLRRNSWCLGRGDIVLHDFRLSCDNAEEYPGRKHGLLWTYSSGN